MNRKLVIALGFLAFLPVAFGASVVKQNHIGQVAVDPGSGINAFGSPMLGVYNNNFMPLSVDANGNLIITASFSGAVNQGNAGTQPWKFDLEQILGATPSATNPLACRISNGTSYLDPTQIRALSSGTDSVNVGNFPATQAVTQSGTWNINNVSGTVSLPTGAATSANQTNGSQQTQIVQGGNTATVTASNAIKVDGSAVTQPVSGTVTANAGTGTFNTNVTNSTLAVTQSGTWTVQPGNTANTTPWLATINQGGNSATVTAGNALKVDGSAVTQPVSGTITANAGTGTFTVGQSTASNLNAQVVGNIASGSTDSGNPVKVGGVYNSTAPTLTNGQRGDLQIGPHGSVIVSGSAAVGSVPTDNPVTISGTDGGGLKRIISTDTSGNVNTLSSVAHTALPTPLSDGTRDSLTVGPYALQASQNEASIMSLWGKMFTVGMPVTSTGVTAETPFLLINNPNASGVIMKIRSVSYGIPTSGNTLYQVYSSPTCTIPSGTVLTPHGNRSTGQASAHTNFYSLPTCSANGTFVLAHRTFTGANELKIQYEFSQYIESNTSVLITSSQSLAAQGDYISIEYSETAQ